ncbi:uncharacterized protein PG998_004576 [Apiospora kogelbergensis]|uniref:Methyltransferase type 11 domain-containing protein n=1 Tax=Apiospora kogelbergensis TaxID=1337665 RepID=A0AAW0QGL0_9PEZI
MSVSFKPKQIVLIDETALQEFLGSATEAVAHEFLRPLVPLPVGSHVHDNGCGSGAITKALFSLQPPLKNADPDRQDIRVSATDRSPAAVKQLQSMATSENWTGVDARSMDSTALSFPDGSFSHSLTGFVFLQLGEGGDVVSAREIHRTLRPGGLAVVATWEDLPSMAVFRQAVEELRGVEGGRPEGALPDMLQMHAYGGRQVEQALLKAGFPSDGMRVERHSTEIRVANARRWCEIGWSICGTTGGKWIQHDEDSWEQVIEYAQQALVTGPWYRRDMDVEGAGWLTLTASVVVARK